MELTELKCSNCAAPLTGAPDAHGLLRCGYCGRNHHVGEAEGAAEPEAPPAPSLEHRPGDPVAVRWGAGWWPATIEQRVGENHWKIHYDGWSRSWDEVVGPERIGPRSAATRSSGGGLGRVVAAIVVVTIFVVVTGVVGAVFSSRGSPWTEPGTPATSDTVFEVGQDVQIEWQGSWYDGTVVSVGDDGRPTVRYDGYGEAWDETVGYERLRIP